MTTTHQNPSVHPALKGSVVVGTLLIVLLYFVGFTDIFAVKYGRAVAAEYASSTSKMVQKTVEAPVLDKADYDRRMLALANISSSTASSTRALWPAKAPYPNAGAILPYKRVVAYYGNFYSTKMGVLGEYPPDVMIQKLNAEVKVWEAADPTTPVVPAIHYIVTTAQGSPQADNTYRLRMPTTEIQKAIDMGQRVHGLVFLDIQVGLSNLPAELPRLEPYLKQSNVHLAIDPEFSMHDGVKPGRVIGTMDATDVNYAVNFLARIVKENNLPPKILVIHRFTEPMITGSRRITPLPEVQVVIDMDGWGFGAKKINTYLRVITKEPVQFAGFKLFYKNDLKPPSTRLLTPAELLKLTPAPIYIQYQ